MREFVTAAKKAHEEPDEGVTITLDGREMVYYQPTDGQLMMFMASSGRHTSTTDAVAGLVDFFMGLFDEPDQIYMSNRLMQRSDPFGHEMIEEMLEAMIEEWTGRPFKLRSDSAPSPTATGRKSTRRTPASTSSASRSTASAT